MEKKFLIIITILFLCYYHYLTKILLKYNLHLLFNFSR